MSDTGRKLTQTANSAGPIGALVLAIAAFASMWESDAQQAEHIRLARQQRERMLVAARESSHRRVRETRDEIPIPSGSDTTRIESKSLPHHASTQTEPDSAADSDATPTASLVTTLTKRGDHGTVNRVENSGSKERKTRRARRRIRRRTGIAARLNGTRRKARRVETAEVNGSSASIETALWMLVDTIRARLIAASTDSHESATSNELTPLQESSRQLPKGITPGIYRVVDSNGRVETVQVERDEAGVSFGPAAGLYSLETSTGTVYFIRQNNDRIANRATDALR